MKQVGMSAEANSKKVGVIPKEQPAHSLFGMTPTFREQKILTFLFLFWEIVFKKVSVIPKEGWVRTCTPIFFWYDTDSGLALQKESLQSFQL